MPRYARSVGFKGDVNQLWEEALSLAVRSVFWRSFGDVVLKWQQDALRLRRWQQPRHWAKRLALAGCSVIPSSLLMLCMVMEGC